MLRHPEATDPDAENIALTVLDSTAEGVYALDREGRCVLANRVCAKLLGYSRPEELFSKPLHELIHHTRADGTPYLAEDCPTSITSRTGEPVYAADELLWRPDGSSFHAELRSQPIVKGGAIVGTVVTFFDITQNLRGEEERRQSIERIEEERALLEAVVEQVPLGALIVEAPSGRLILANARARTLVGEAIEEFGSLRGLHLDGTPYQPHEWPLARAIRCGEVVMDEELDLLASGGRRIAVLARAAPVRDREGQIVAAIGTLMDISRRKREEARHRLFSDAGVVLSAGLETDEVLRRLAELVVPKLANHCEIYRLQDDGGLEPSPAVRYPAGTELARDRSWDDRLKETLHSGRPRLIGNSVELVGGVTSAMLVPLIARARVHGLVALLSTTRAFDEYDLETAQELAARGALAADNARLYEQARLAMHHRDDVLAIVAHDLRNPLSAIGLISQTMKLNASAGEVGAAVRRHGALIERTVGLMNRLLNDLADLGALQTGHLTLELAPELPEELAHEAIELYRIVADHKGLLLGCEVAHALPTVVCDRHRILEVLGNLLGNALKVSQRGDSISVHVEQVDESVRFAVADRGPGIAAENIPRLFEPYWRARDARYKGTGLGLPIAKGIVSAHHGRIWADSLLGAGTTFYFTLPTSP